MSPEIWFFVWLVMHKRIPVNEYRAHIGLVTDDYCDRCQATIETLVHCLRDCTSSMAVWETLIP